MNIYEISQTTNRGYNTYDSAIVYAGSEAEAQNTSPSTGRPLDNSDKWSWVSDPALVSVEKIGSTWLTEPGIVLASFNAE